MAWYCYRKDGRGYVGFGRTREAAEDDQGCPGGSWLYTSTPAGRTPGTIKAERAAQELDGEV